MDSLRIALAVAGVLTLAGVYVWSRFQERRRRSEKETSEDAAPLPEEGDMEPVTEVQPPADIPGPELLIVLYVLAPRGRAFTGPAVAEAADAAGLVYGERHVYHAYSEGAAEGEPLFVMANALEPGTFDADRLVGFSTPGLVLFQHLPGPRPGREVFYRMVDAGRALAGSLDGTLCDESRCALTEQAIGRIGERIDTFELELRRFEKERERG